MGKHTVLDRLNIIIFIGVLAIWGVLVFVLPKQTYSELEERSLRDIPQFSWEAYWKADYMDSLDAYVADNFPMREHFVNLSFQMEKMRGFPSNELAEYDVAFNLDEGIEEMEEDTNEEDVMNRDSLMKTKGNADEVENIGKVLFYNGRAIQRFGGKNTTKYGVSTEFDAEVINEYYDSLGGQARIFSMIVPSAGEILLPSEYRKGKRGLERENIASIYSMLNPNVRTVDACLELHKHKDEYLYFATDHHWTGRGAYYGYVAFCKAAGWEPTPLEHLDRNVIHGFLGSLYRATRDPRLAANEDSVEYFKVANRHKAWAIRDDKYEVQEKKMVYVEYANGVHSYGVFLSRDYPLMRIETDIEDGKTGLIIKNSYGNPFATYLVGHYKRLFVIDYRKFKGNIVQFARDHKVDDIIIFQSSFSANTSSHINKIRQMLYAPLICPTMEREPDLFKEENN